MSTQKYAQIDSLDPKDIKDIFRVIALETLGSWSAIEETLKVNRNHVIDLSHLRKLIELSNAKVIVKISYEGKDKGIAPVSPEAQLQKQAEEITNPELKGVAELPPLAVIPEQKAEEKTPEIVDDDIPTF